MEDVHCHAPQPTSITSDAFLGPVYLHDGVVHVYIRLPRCQDNHDLLDICLGIRHCRDSSLAAVKIDNEVLHLLLPARGSLCRLCRGLSRRRAGTCHHSCPQRREDQEGY